jgi:hypothetical protein
MHLSLCSIKLLDIAGCLLFCFLTYRMIRLAQIAYLLQREHTQYAIVMPTHLRSNAVPPSLSSVGGPN